MPAFASLSRTVIENSTLLSTLRMKLIPSRGGSGSCSKGFSRPKEHPHSKPYPLFYDSEPASQLKPSTYVELSDGLVPETHIERRPVTKISSSVTADFPLDIEHGGIQKSVQIEQISRRI